MKKFITILILMGLPTLLTAQQFEVVTIAETASIDKRINLVFLGDGYRSAQLGQYLNDVEDIVEQLFDTSPLKEYKDHFNVYAIKVPSNESGAARDPAALIDNYFGSTYNYAGIERLLVPTRNDRVAAVLADNFPQYDQVFMVVNDDKYGGSGGWIATASTHSESGEVAIHEIGHSFAALSDEYWAGSQYAWETDNMTRNSNTSTNKWTNWIGDQGIGIYPHSGDATWYKPHQNCKMQFLGVDFCAVCIESLIKTIHSLTNPVDAFDPTEQDQLNSIQNFGYTRLSPTPNTLKSFWVLDNDTIEYNTDIISLQSNELSGLHQLKLSVVDTTKFSRKNTLKMSTITWSIEGGAPSNQVRSEFITSIILRQDLETPVVTGVDDLFITDIALNTYPNPAGEKITITFNNPTPAPFELQLVDIGGKMFQQNSIDLLPQGPQRFEVNTSEISTGLFLVYMRIGDRLVIQKVIK